MPTQALLLRTPRTTLNTCAAVLLVLGLITPGLAAAQAPAQPAPPTAVGNDAGRAEAQRLVREGATHFEAGRYAAALDKFSAAFARFPSAKIQFNIGQAERRLRHAVAATTAFEAFLQGVPNPTAEDRAEAQAAIKELAAEVARLEVKAFPAGAEVAIDGTPTGKSPLPRPLVLAPGTHEIRISLPGHQTVRELIPLKGGSSEKFERTLLAAEIVPPPRPLLTTPPPGVAQPGVAPPGVAQPGVAPPPAGAPPALTGKAPPPATRSSGSGQRTIGKILVWAGAGFATVGVGLLGGSWLSYAEAKDGKCDDDMSCHDAKDKVDGYARWSKIAFAAAGVSAVVGGTLVLTARPQSIALAGRF